ncbi:hypothetical protein GJ496_007153, partial [Pomphorhynchus laevis]
MESISCSQPCSKSKNFNDTTIDLSGKCIHQNIGSILNDEINKYCVEIGICSKIDHIFIAITVCTFIDISYNKLKSLPEIPHFGCLSSMLVHHNHIEQIPSSTFQIPSLTKLDLSHNKLSLLPSSIGQLQNLEILIVNNNKIEIINDEICSLKHLIYLDYSKNQITALPRQIAFLHYLRYLNVSSNNIKELPKELSGLRNLTKLYCSFNSLKRLPSCLRELHDLCELCVDNNPLELPPLSVVRKGLVHIMKYLMTEAYLEEKSIGLSSDAEILLKIGTTPNLCRFTLQANGYVNLNFNSDNQLSEFDGEVISTHSASTTTNDTTYVSSCNLKQLHFHQEDISDEFTKELSRQVFDYEQQKLNARAIKQHLLDQYSQNEDKRQKIRDEARRTHVERLQSIERRRNHARDNIQNNNRLSRYDCKYLTTAISKIPDQQIDSLAVIQSKFVRAKSLNSGNRVSNLQHDGSIKLIPNEIGNDAKSRNQSVHDDGAMFTIRRKFQQIQHEFRFIEQVKKSRLSMRIPGSFASAISDGVLPCQLVNLAKPSLISNIHLPDIESSSISLAKSRKNIEGFLCGCKHLGIKESDLCCAQDIIEGRNIFKVALTINALLNIGNSYIPKNHNG